MKLRDFNLPPGTTQEQIDPAPRNVCHLCDALCHDEVCEDHEQEWDELKQFRAVVEKTTNDL